MSLDCSTILMMITRARSCLGLVALVVLARLVTANAETASDIARVTADAKAEEAAVIHDQIRLCEIPAGTFRETRRAAAMKDAFEAAGLRRTSTDRVGNVETGNTQAVLDGSLDQFLEASLKQGL